MSNYAYLGSSKHFNLYYDIDLYPFEIERGKDILRTCETDYDIYSSWFGGVHILSFDVYVDGGQNGASHSSCGSTTIYIDANLDKPVDFQRMLVNSEVVEVFENNHEGRWDCGMSPGEGLSRTLAEAIYPSSIVLNGNNSSPAKVWLDGPRTDWVFNLDNTDQNYDSIGCSVLFLNWLRYQLGYRWQDIVAAGLGFPHPFWDMPLDYVYHTLIVGDGNWSPTGGPWNRFIADINAFFPPGKAVDLTTNNPFPILLHRKWSGWVNLGHPPSKGFYGTPAVVSKWPGTLDCFATDFDGAVWWRNWNGANWGGWINLGGNCPNGIGAISRNRYGFDIYGSRANTNDLGRYVYDPFSFPPQPDGWYGITLGNNQFWSVPAVASWSPDRIDVFARGKNEDMLHRVSNDSGSSFYDWFSLGQPPVKFAPGSSPAAISIGPNRVACFARSVAGNLWQRSWNHTSWATWAEIGKTAMIRDPAVASWSPNRVDIFCVDATKNLVHAASNDGGATWSGWGSLGTPPGTTINSSPAAVSWAANRIDFFVIGGDNNLWHRAWG